jgi:hypothetical protein
MLLQDVREILLDQHDALRVKIGEARRAGELWRRGAYPRAQLQRLLSDLSGQLITHHECEERLRDIIPTIDACGIAPGEELMGEGHVDEHRNFLARLHGAAECADAEEGAAAIKVLLDSMIDHMRYEERYLLASDVLTDDLRFGEGFAG